MKYYLRNAQNCYNYYIMITSPTVQRYTMKTSYYLNAMRDIVKFSDFPNAVMNRLCDHIILRIKNLIS